MEKVEPDNSVDFIRTIMVSPVETVKPTDRLEQALKKIVRKNIGCVVVVERNRPVGIVTERDISRNVAKSTKVLGTEIKRVMSSPLVVVTQDAPIDKAVYLMLKHGIRRLPVVEKGELIGLVSERDLLRWVLQISYEPRIPIEIRKIQARRAEAKISSKP